LKKEHLRLNATPFQNATNVVEFLCSTFAKEYVGPSNAHQIVFCIFWNVGLGDVDTSQAFGCVTVDVFCKMHSISFWNHLDYELLIPKLNCFCPTYVDGGDEDDRDFRSHVKPWKTIMLIPIERYVARSRLDDSNFQTIWRGDG
jgi:hypothetical protein